MNPLNMQPVPQLQAAGGSGAADAQKPSGPPTSFGDFAYRPVPQPPHGQALAHGSVPGQAPGPAGPMLQAGACDGRPVSAPGGLAGMRPGAGPPAPRVDITALVALGKADCFSVLVEAPDAQAKLAPLYR